MGGRGSTRWRGYSTRTIIADQAPLQFSARELVRCVEGGWLAPGGTIAWLGDSPEPPERWDPFENTRGGSFRGLAAPAKRRREWQDDRWSQRWPVARARFVPDEWLGRREPQIFLALRARRQPSGGLVWRLVCPKCNVRRLALYWLALGLPTCRACSGVVYASQRATPRGRAEMRMEKLARQMVPWWDDARTFPARPAGCHRRRYDRLWNDWKDARWQSLSRAGRELLLTPRGFNR